MHRRFVVCHSLTAISRFPRETPVMGTDVGRTPAPLSERSSQHHHLCRLVDLRHQLLVVVERLDRPADKVSQALAAQRRPLFPADHELFALLICLELGQVTDIHQGVSSCTAVIFCPDRSAWHVQFSQVEPEPSKKSFTGPFALSHTQTTIPCQRHGHHCVETPQNF